MDLTAKRHMAVWILLGLAFAMRLGFHAWIAWHGEAVLPNRDAIRREGLASVMARAVGFICLLAVLGLYGINPPWLRRLTFPLPAQAGWAGFLLGLAGLALWTWTHLALGRQWSAQLALRQEHRLVTSGPYARVRHPMYTSIFLWVTGVAVVSANWMFVVLAGAIIAGLSARTPREEQMMLGAFGEQYRAYMNRTGRYFPRRG